MNKLNVAFVCVHNSCRSQIAEALAKKFYSDVFHAYSAGTETKTKLNQDAVRLMKKMFQIDIEEDQYSKLIETLPTIDIVITMGCEVECPQLPCRYREDWGLEDPTGLSDEVFIKLIHSIENKLLDLRFRLENKTIILR